MTCLRPPGCSISFVISAALTATACGDDSSDGTGSGGSDSTTGDRPTTTTTATTGGPTTTDPTTTNPATTGTATDSTTTDPDTTVADGSGTTTVGPMCGDGAVDDGETCDDGNTDPGDGCNAECAVEDGWECDEANPTPCMSICGDGVTVGDEECDDDNDVDTDACTNACLDAVCGDGIVREGMEECDDGNVDPDDGCSAACEVEGPGIVCDDAMPSNCFPAAFMAVGAGTATGNLYAMSLDGATTVEIGPLNAPLTAMAFHPDGTLYAVTSTRLLAPTSELGTVDTETAVYTPIGAIGAGMANHPAVPDITFMGEQLVGWTEGLDDMLLIDTDTAAVTIVASPESSIHTGLAYNPGTDELFLASEGSNDTLYTVDELGNVTAGATLGGLNGGVQAMAFADGILYGLDSFISGSGGSTGDFVTYDTATGAMTVLSPLPVTDIDALAVYDPTNVVAP